MKSTLTFLALGCALAFGAATAYADSGADAPVIAQATPAAAPAPEAKAPETKAAEPAKAEAPGAAAAAAPAPPAPTEPQLVAADKINSGDTAWMLTSTALVLLMTIPGSRYSTAAWCARRTCSRR